LMWMSLAPFSMAALKISIILRVSESWMELENSLVH